MMRQGNRFPFDKDGRKTISLCEWKDEAEVRIDEDDRKWITCSPEEAHKIADWIKQNVPPSHELRLRFAEREAKEAVERLAKLKRREAEEDSDETE